MSKENVEVVRQSILGWNERKVEALIDVLDPSVEFHPPEESMNPGIYQGHDGVRDYFRRVGEMFEEQRVESVEVEEVDAERLIATVHGFGKFVQFEEEVDMRWAFLITIRDGKGTCVETFTDRHQALEAAGLEE